jgi:hypothetical protein
LKFTIIKIYKIIKGEIKILIFYNKNTKEFINEQLLLSEKRKIKYKSIRRNI